MSQVESTLRMVNGRLVGNRNWRYSSREGWDFRHITLRRQLMEQEVREIIPVVNQEGIVAVLLTPPMEDDLDDLDVDFTPEDYDEEQERPDPDAELEEFCSQEHDEQYENSGEDPTDAALGAVTFDIDRTPTTEDRCWDGLENHLEAMRSYHNGEIQEHEIHLDGISSTHLYHAARSGIIAADRFDLYGDRNPPAWWPVIECA